MSNPCRVPFTEKFGPAQQREQSLLSSSIENLYSLHSASNEWALSYSKDQAWLTVLTFQNILINE